MILRYGENQYSFFSNYPLFIIQTAVQFLLTMLNVASHDCLKSLPSLASAQRFLPCIISRCLSVTQPSSVLPVPKDSQFIQDHRFYLLALTDTWHLDTHTTQKNTSRVGN